MLTVWTIWKFESSACFAQTEKVYSHYWHHTFVNLRCVSVVYCPKLPTPLHGTLSSCETIHNTLVVVACDIGFKHADGQTSKTVLCLDNTTWNDTDIDCQGLCMYLYVVWCSQWWAPVVVHRLIVAVCLYTSYVKTYFRKTLPLIAYCSGNLVLNSTDDITTFSKFVSSLSLLFWNSSSDNEFQTIG